MHRVRLGGTAWLGLSVAACTPPLDPEWLITRPRELALEVEVATQGPYGARILPGPRSPRDALPLDTLTMRPVVLTPEGPLEPAELEGTWLLCRGLGNCLLRAPPPRQRPRCTAETLLFEPCTFGEGGEATLTVPDLPRMLAEPTTVFNLLNGPTIALIASPPGGPGVEACIARLEARERLDGCLLMERLLGLGPLGELVATFEQLGLDPGVDPDAESLLARPRNRNPAVERFEVNIDGQPAEARAGARLTIPRDRDVVLTVVTTEDDLDAYEAMVGEQTITFSDELSAEWAFDRELELVDAPIGRLSARIRAGALAGSFRAYAALRDGAGGEGWGFIELQPEG